jgi:23S rRNA pseudouridine2605 synthase
LSAPAEEEGPPARSGDAPEGGERLQKVLARAGLGSRRACEELIDEGRVEVNGEVAVLGRRVDPEHDRVTVDGVTLPVRPGLVYYLLNKPARVVTTAHDPEGRPTVIDLVPAEPRVFPVGRLDWDTEGLLLLTNDGDLAHGLTHPSRGVPKTYLAEVAGVPGKAALRRLREGVDLDDGRTAPARARLAQSTPSGSALEIVIHEGRNRQVRRMFEAIGHPLRQLHRSGYAGLTLEGLEPGTWRELEPDEVESLRATSSGTPSSA